MSSRFLNAPVLSLVVIIGLLSITLAGGCPGPQTPTTPTDQEEETTPTTPTTPDDGLEEPITPPNFDDDTTSSGNGSSISTNPEDQGNGGGGGGSGQTEPGLVMITVDEPSEPLGVRPGTIITVEFELLDVSGSVKSGELLLARDVDQDGVADGNAILKLPIVITAGTNAVEFDTGVTVGLLANGLGHFVLGVGVTTESNEVKTKYSQNATITVDAVEPTVTWVGAGSPPYIPLDRDDHLVNRDTDWTIKLSTADNSAHTVSIIFDNDDDPSNGNVGEFVTGEEFAAGSAVRSFTQSLQGRYQGVNYYRVIVSDGIDPPVDYYLENPFTANLARLSLTDRLIGTFELERLAETPSNPQDSKGVIMQGVNFNDLAGSSMVSVPDLNGDDASELIIGARYGKPNLATYEGQGWGEAYMIYGQGSRLSGVGELNSVGTSIDGLTFRGIRVRQNQSDTLGLADITVIDDMDGDELPEVVFSFPRAESITLGMSDPAIQLPELAPDEPGMGLYEYNAYHNAGDPAGFDSPVWNANEAQFTRGGIVIVSSHNEMLTDNDTVTRKLDRVLDLHEVGQMFNFMTRASLACYIREVHIEDPSTIDPNGPGCYDCDDSVGECGGDPNNAEETEYTYVMRYWDVWLGGG